MEIGKTKRECDLRLRSEGIILACILMRCLVIAASILGKKRPKRQQSPVAGGRFRPSYHEQRDYNEDTSLSQTVSTCGVKLMGPLGAAS